MKCVPRRRCAQYFLYQALAQFQYCLSYSAISTKQKHPLQMERVFFDFDIFLQLNIFCG
jgi:hypothetical protein